MKQNELIFNMDAAMRQRMIYAINSIERQLEEIKDALYDIPKIQYEYPASASEAAIRSQEVVNRLMGGRKTAID